MKWINLCRIYIIIIYLIIFIAGCNKKQESLIISEKTETDVKFYGKIREVNVYYSNPINLCFDIEIGNNVLTSVNSMDVEFYIDYKDFICGFYNFYRIENNLLSICIYTDLLNCHNINDEILTNKQKNRLFFACFR